MENIKNLIRFLSFKFITGLFLAFGFAGGLFLVYSFQTATPGPSTSWVGAGTADNKNESTHFPLYTRTASNTYDRNQMSLEAISRKLDSLGATADTYSSCKALLAAVPGLPSGAYVIDPDGTGPNMSYRTYCDMTTDGGGWTLIAKSYWASMAYLNTANAYGSCGDSTTTICKIPDADVNTITTSASIFRMDGPEGKRYFAKGATAYGWAVAAPGRYYVSYNNVGLTTGLINGSYAGIFITYGGGYTIWGNTSSGWHYYNGTWDGATQFTVYAR